MKLAYGVGVSSCKGMVTPLLYADFIDFEVGVTIPLKIRLTSRVKGGQTRRRVLEGHNAPIRFTQNLDREATTQMGLATDSEWVTVGPPTTLPEDGAVGPLSVSRIERRTSPEPRCGIQRHRGVVSNQWAPTQMAASQYR